MIQHPGILALLVASGIVSLLLAAAGWQGFRILLGWDLHSGSEVQLDLERRTYLVSTLVANALLIQILSLFLFIFTADGLHNQFVGAMCAAGSLAVNAYGYPTLLMKVATCLLAGVWLVHLRSAGGHWLPAAALPPGGRPVLGPQPGLPARGRGLADLVLLPLHL